jgi:hypothetical protein
MTKLAKVTDAILAEQYAELTAELLERELIGTFAYARNAQTLANLVSKTAKTYPPTPVLDRIRASVAARRKEAE